MKKALAFILSLIFVFSSVPFFAIAEPTYAVELYEYTSGGAQSFIGGYDTLAAAVNETNARDTVDTHFLIKLNSSVTLYTEGEVTILNPAATGPRTVTIDGQGIATVNMLAHNGIVVGEGESYTKTVNLNIVDLSVVHKFTGSAVQDHAPGVLNIDGCVFNITGENASETAENNYTVINGCIGAGLKLTMNISNTAITVTRPSLSTGGRSVLRTGNTENYVDINIDNCNISSNQSAMDTIRVHKTLESNISIQNSTISAVGARIVFAPLIDLDGDEVSNEGLNRVHLTLGHSTFYIDGEVCYDQSAAIYNVGTTVNSPTFTGHTSIGGYDTFPELIITEVHLESINVGSDAGPFNPTTNGWAGFDWWGDSHPKSYTEADNGDFLRYIEVYNASNSNVDLMKYKLCVDVDASSEGSTVNVLDIAPNATVGSIENHPTAVIKPGETAILYLYNPRDEELRCTVENFKGYYGWRYNGSDETLDDYSGIAPNERDTYLVVDLTDTTVVAVDDTQSTTKLGDFERNSIYYGLAKDETNVTEDRTAWESWVLFEHYDNVEASNQGDQETFNFLYGLDASADIREGRRLNETRSTHNCNPGLLQAIQKLNFPNSGVASDAPEITITEINNYTYEAGVTDGNFDYIEVANISAVDINIYDYCILGRWDIINTTAGKAQDFSIYWFDRVNYIIPYSDGNTVYGDIQSHTNVKSSGDMAPYTGSERTPVYKNPVYSEGVLKPGETAVIWMYDENCYIDELGLDDFKNYFGGGDTTKVFAMSGYRNQSGEQSMSIGISNTSFEIYGIARLDAFKRETLTGSNGTYPEILKEPITYDNTSATRTGYSILKCECVVFMFSSMLDSSLGKNSALGVNVAYQYAAAYVNGAALRFAGFLSTIRKDTDESVVTDAWNATPTTLVPEQAALVNSFKNYSYTVTYKANGGTGNDVTQFAYDGTPLRLPFEIFTAPAGKTLIGWSETAGGDPYIVPGTSVDIKSNTVYYAVWGEAQNPTYLVTIPDTLTISEVKAGTMRITVSDILYFTEGDTIDVSISTDDGKFELIHTTDPGTVDPLTYELISEQLDKVLTNNAVAATFTRDSETEAILRAELVGDPIFAGTYSDTLTFKITFTDR